jgi:hypothetical protein
MPPGWQIAPDKGVGVDRTNQLGMVGNRSAKLSPADGSEENVVQT